jgi:electron transfer flavoprotein beta subunit
MKILVCVKAVPDLELPLGLNDSAKWIELDESIPLRMNRFDEFAVEEALLIREAFPSTVIDVITVGPDHSDSVLIRSMGMGADHGIHILYHHEGYVSPYVTAFLIASCARGKGYDLILTGIMAEDDMFGQVGPMIAEQLSMPYATSAIFERLSPGEKSVYVEREMEGGRRDCLDLRLPALLAIQSGINRPRYPFLSKMLRARRHPLEIIDSGRFDRPESREEVIRVGYPQKSRSCRVLQGTPQQKAAQLLEILVKRSLIQRS